VKRAFIILNPAAGRGRGFGLELPLAETARRLGWETVVRFTRRAGDEIDLAAEAREAGWPVVVAAGGDGTVHGTVNGLLADGPTSVTLAHVPIGSGNDYARALNLKAGPVARNLARALQGRRHLHDVGRVEHEYFVNGMGVGFDAEVVRHTLRMSHLSGFPMYLAAVYRTFGSFDPPDLEIEAAEHQERGRVMMLNVSIGPTQGGGFKIAPGARPDDGLFHVCVIRRVGFRRFLRYVPSVVAGRHTGLPEVTVFPTTRVRVTGLSGPLALQLDGELRYPKRDTVEVTLLPRYLHVLCAA
jgi:diacylglycerol kinase (ATP)